MEQRRSGRVQQQEEALRRLREAEAAALEQKQREVAAAQEAERLARQEEARMAICKVVMGLQDAADELETWGETSDDIEDFSLPIEIMLAPPPREVDDFMIPEDWKPHDDLKFRPFKMLQQNSYRGHDVTKPEISFESVPTCNCSMASGCNESCQNRLVLMECAPGNCPSLFRGKDEYCSNTVIQRRAFPATEVFKTRSCGYGLRLLEDVGPGTIIIEYLGQVITCEEGQRRMSSMKNSDDFYFMSLGNGLMLDAKPMGSNARFANHSCDPNCTLQKWTVLGETRLVLVSFREIRAGMEITYNYNYYADGLGDIPRQKCQCGATSCSGSIGGRMISSVEQKWMDRAHFFFTGRRHSLEVAREHLEVWRTLQEEAERAREQIELAEELSSNQASKKRKRTSQKRKNRLKGLSEAVSFSELEARVAEENHDPEVYTQLRLAVEAAEAWREEVNLYLTPSNDGKITAVKPLIFSKLLARAPEQFKMDELVDVETKLRACEKMEKNWAAWEKRRTDASTSAGTKVGNDIDVSKGEKPQESLQSTQSYITTNQYATDFMRNGYGTDLTAEVAKVSDSNSIGQVDTSISTIMDGATGSAGNERSKAALNRPLLQPMKCTWKEWVGDIKELRGMAPVFCSAAPPMLRMYKSCGLWCTEELLPYFSNGFQAMKVAPHTPLITSGSYVLIRDLIC